MKKFVLFVMSVSLIALLAFFGERVPAKHSPPKNPDPTQNALRDWKAEIETLGPAGAYQKLLTVSTSSSSSIQHLNGHLFGDALYDARGLSGFSICGMELNGGCLHEFVGRAIQDAGVSIVEELSTECINRFGLMGATACQHGIGHGLVADLGYKENELNAALTECSKLPAARPERACYGGAFMEFNQRAMADNIQRPFDPASPFSLCDHVNAPYRPACYFWTPIWLMGIEFGPRRTTKEYAAAGAYCEQAPSEYADSCFGGLGYFAPPSTEFDTEKTIQLCNAVSTTQKYRDDCWGVAKEAVVHDAAPAN